MRRRKQQATKTKKLQENTTKIFQKRLQVKLIWACFLLVYHVYQYHIPVRAANKRGICLPPQITIAIALNESKMLVNALCSDAGVA